MIINRGIPDNGSVEGVVISEGNPPSPESEEFRKTATYMLFAIWAPIAVSRPFSPRAMIPSISPKIKAEIIIDKLIIILLPLKK